MAHLSIRVLGEFAVSQGDEALASFESDKVRALLAYLVVEADRPHRRAALAGLLWPDYPEASARHNLSQALFNLRLVLGDHTARPPYLLISRDAVQFNRDSAYQLDLEAFNAHFSAWEKGRAAGDPDISPLQALVELYRGDFLHEFDLKDSAEFEEWILVQRSALHARLMPALDALVDACEHRCDFAAAQRACLRQLQLDPWREEAHASLMRLLALDGQRTAALAQYETCKKILREELGVEPSPATRDLYERIRSGQLQPGPQVVHPAPAAPLPRLPLPLTPFLGREAELSELEHLLSTSACRCLTLVGPGGMGKTRLALEAAERNKRCFAHGAAFVPLVSVASPAGIVAAIASALGLGFSGPADPHLQLLNYLGNKHLLLILDNLEHLLVEESAHELLAAILVDILHKAPQVTLLLTSRLALNLSGEWIFEVQGLDVPQGDAGDLAGSSSAEALFVQHARRVRPDFELDPGSRASLARLCRRVEGMPLAIELAAAWIRLLSVEEIAAEIERSLDFLSVQLRDLPERHRSLRAVFDHSWELLSPSEQHVLSCLSVFRGGFDRRAGEAIAGASLLALSALVTRSLVRRSGSGRYDLHELVRQFAAARLAEDPAELHRIQGAHSRYYLGWLAARDERLHSQDQKTALGEISDEIHNLRAAWDWAADHQTADALYLASTAFKQVFELRGWFQEGEQLFGCAAQSLSTAPPAAAPAVDPQLVREVLLAHSACFMFRQGQSEAAYALLSPCVARLRSATAAAASAAAVGVQIAPPLVVSLIYLGIVSWELGRFSESIAALQEGLALAQASGQRWFAAHFNEFLGIVAWDRGDYAPARAYLSQALAIFREFGDRPFIAHTLSYLGRTMLALGEYDQAEKLLRQSLKHAQEIDYRFGCGLALDALGQVAYARGEYPQAQSLFSECASLFQEIGDSHRLARARSHHGLAALALGQVVEARAAFQSALSLAQAGGLLPVALSALSGLAALQARQTCDQPTLELVLFLLHHPLANQQTKTLAGKLQAELEVHLPPLVVEAAHACASEKNLDELVGLWMA